MNELICESQPPVEPGLLSLFDQSLFHGPDWQKLLQKAFHITPYYIWDESGSVCLTVSVFKAGPFKLGYVGFPAGNIAHGGNLDTSEIRKLERVLNPKRIHLLHYPVSAFSDQIRLPYPATPTPETAIEDLHNWSKNKLRKNVKWGINKARRDGIQIIDAKDPQQGKIIYDLYRETIIRHGGVLRYNVQYFIELIKLSTQTHALRCLMAEHEGNWAGFLVTAISNRTAYYLHGATHPDYLKSTAGDLLVYEAIIWAQSLNLDCFNMMSSPPGQSGLINFKEKWGGITKSHQRYTLAINPFWSSVYQTVFKINQSLMPLLSRIKMSKAREAKSSNTESKTHERQS